MGTTHHQHSTDRHTAGTGTASGSARARSGRTGRIAGVAVLLACAAACSLPLLLAGGAAVTAGAQAATAEPPDRRPSLSPTTRRTPLTRSITRDDLQALLVAGTVTLIEALPVAHYDSGHLPGALNVPDRLAPDLAARLVPDASRTVVTYCSGPACTRSKTTAAPGR